jgi:hypothetical protein
MFLTKSQSTFNRLDLQCRIYAYPLLTNDSFSYIGTAYLLSSTVFLPIFASAADIYGRHSALHLFSSSEVPSVLV